MAYLEPHPETYYIDDIPWATCRHTWNGTGAYSQGHGFAGDSQNHSCIPHSCLHSTCSHQNCNGKWGVGPVRFSKDPSVSLPTTAEPGRAEP